MVSTSLAVSIIMAVMPVFIAAFILYAVRGVKGPTLFDTVLAIDAMCIDVAAFMVLLALYFRSYLLLGAPIFLTLWAYILDILVARYFSKKLRRGVGYGS